MIICIAGPTASGKTALAVALAQALVLALALVQALVQAQAVLLSTSS